MKLPKPVWMGDIPGYTEAQMRQAIRDAYEEAAKVCESLAMQQDTDVRDECAAAIRKLKEEVCT